MTALQHELSCYPLSLFETAELLHEAQKATFAYSILINLKQKDPQALENPRYVLDGGALLYRIPWTRGSSFSTLLKMYADYVNLTSAFMDQLFLMDMKKFQLKI